MNESGQNNPYDRPLEAQLKAPSPDLMKSRVVVLGSHKGLGYECVKSLLGLDTVDALLGLSRRDTSDFTLNPKYQFRSFDFTKAYDNSDIFENLRLMIDDFNPTNIIYCAGGGPHGSYAAKAWKDHEWALKLNFLFPAKLLWALAEKPGLKTFTYVGSSIAESEAGDPDGASYAAGKWAMKGLVKSLMSQKTELHIDVFSPGYMDTGLLPLGSKPRQSGVKLENPADVAQLIVRQIGL